jgi:DNA-binding transcriptional LysR family regulator
MSTAPFSQLQAFLCVARHRSFSRAAHELGVSRAAISQAVSQLEAQLRVVLLTRTTRSVALTDGGQRLVERAGPAFGQVLSALTEAAIQPGELTGRVRLSLPRSAIPFVVETVLPTFRARHPRIEVEFAIESRRVDLVAEGYDAGVRLVELIERDMVQVRLTEPFRFLVVGAPSYLARHGTPERPRELLHHECINLRSPNTGQLLAWEFERGRKSWRIPVRGGIVGNDVEALVSLAEKGLGLAYATEPSVMNALREGRLRRVLEAYAPTVPGLFLYFPSGGRSSGPLRLFVEVARELAMRHGKDA